MRENKRPTEGEHKCAGTDGDDVAEGSSITTQPQQQDLKYMPHSIINTLSALLFPLLPDLSNTRGLQQCM